MSKPLKIAVCGGGTAGHYYPALSVVKEMQKRTACEVLYFTSSGRIDDKRVEIDLPGAIREPLLLRGLQRPIFHPRNAKTLSEHFSETSRVRVLLKGFRPDLTFSTGGYISFPVVRASRRERVPVYIHEQNALPGLANRKLARYARLFFVSFEESKALIPINKEKIILSGNPVRSPSKQKEEVLSGLNFKQDLPFFVVMGGSLGSDMINNLCEKLYILVQKERPDFQFLHVTGNPAATRRLRSFSFVRSFDYVEDLNNYMYFSDCVLARGGATTIAELMRYKTRGIIIPWPQAADNHQYFNALSLANAGLGCVILENAATEDRIFKELIKCTEKGQSFPDTESEPAEVIAEYLLRGV